MAQWYFNTNEDDDLIHLRVRVEDGDTVVHAQDEVGPGDAFFGVSYEDMAEMRHGIVEVDDDDHGTLHEVPTD